MKILYEGKKEDSKVIIEGLKYDPNEAESTLFDTSAAITMIVGEMIDKLAHNAPVDLKKDLAGHIIDSAKENLFEYYDYIQEAQTKKPDEVDLYDFMLDCYEDVIEEYDIDEEEIVSLARTEEPQLYVEEKDDNYLFKLSLGDRIYTFGKMPTGLSYNESDKESFRATLAALVLFDKAFPEDENKNPVKNSGAFNLYYEMLMEHIDPNNT